MIPADKIVLDFRNFLVVNWQQIFDFAKNDETESFLVDWLQANWELLVERRFNDPNLFLEVYGDGAENGKSSRYSFLDKLPTSSIICLPHNSPNVFDYLNQKEVKLNRPKLNLDRFVRIREDGWYDESPPFDKVLCFSEGREIVIGIEDVSFFCEEIGE